MTTVKAAAQTQVLSTAKSHGNVEPVRVASDPNQRMVNLWLTAYYMRSHHPGCR
jgi:hypothetical protein